MQCGVACLTMLCRHHGLGYTPHDIEDLCHATNQGVSLKALADGGKELGLECTAGKINIQGIQHIPLPCIAHWNQNHFVLITAVKHMQGYLYNS